MNGYLYDALFRVPSVESFLDRLLVDLASKRNLVALLPTGLDPERVWNRLRANLWKREFTFEEIPMSSNPRSREPVLAISEAIGASWPDVEIARSIPNLLRCPDLPDVIYLEGIHQLDSEGLKIWFDFIQYWTINCQQLRTNGGSHPVICIILEGDSPLPFIPNSDVCLAVHWWWGFPSLLESHLLCRMAREEEIWDSVAMWREYILPSLVGNDISLMAYLWDSIDASLDQINQLLLCFSEERGWSQDKIHSWEGHHLERQNGDLRIQQNFPPKRYQRLWANGALSSSLEQGIELHSAALATLGDQDTLKHRLWRGQTKIILPMLDSYRLEICRLLTDSYGSDWPTRWDQPKDYEDLVSVHENPLSAQWGYLEHLLEHRSPLARFQYLLPLVSLGRFIRNEIAHYRPISYKDFNNLNVEGRCLHDR